jgi:transcriptional regulator GlxA family with amidase domain
MRTSSQSLAVVLFDEVALLDVALPLEVLTTAGRVWNFRPFKVFAVAAAPGSVKTPSQLELPARHCFADCPTPEMVLVPGGYGARRALGDDAVLQYLRGVAPGASLLFGVGNGVLLLAAAGLLGAADVSVTADAAERLHDLDASTRADTASRFRRSGRVLTASTPAGAAEAALGVVAELLGKKQALAVAAMLGLPPPAAPGGVEIVSLPK